MKKRTAASSNPLPAPTAIQAPYKSIRSCSRCIQKKGKCQPSIPYCGPCWSGGRTEDCDIQDHIVLPYSAAKEREDGEDQRRKRIEWLEGEMSRRTGTDVAGMVTGSTIEGSDRTLGRVPVDPLSLELGLLALDASRAPSRSPPYVGTASGLTITRLLSAVLEQGETAEAGSVDEDVNRRVQRAVCAGIPPLDIARSHLNLFLQRVHRDLPFLDVAEILSVFDNQYHASPDRCIDTPNFERFLFFAILAIGSSEARSTSIKSAMDPFSPKEYISAAIPFFERLSVKSDFETLKALLLMIVYGISDATGPPISLWHFTGHAMRIAIELGLTRPVSAWSFPPGEEESRRKIWWCTYRLERSVAVRLGRVLSIRNAGIDAEWPLDLEETTPVSRVLDSPLHLDYRAGLHLVRLSRIYGDILESVYIARPVNRPSMTIEETLQRVWTIQNTLVDWANSIPSISTPQSDDYNLLTLAFHRACLLLHRPSPSFPNQPENVHSVCIRSARAAINLSLSMLKSRLLSRNWQNFHDSFLDGLVLMFSSWASPISVGAITVLNSTRDQDLENCSIVLAEFATCLPSSARRYIDTFNGIVAAFERLLGIGVMVQTQQGAEESLFDWSIFESLDGFELEQGAVEMIRMMTSGTNLEPE